MSLSLGIVGLPNVGKSTLFKALTRNKVDIANYPFCTIDPNVGVVTVPDERLQKLSDISHSQKIVPTAIEFVDIAGLVAGAHKGEGLGNKFLQHIREVDAICQVVRVFADDNIIHVTGKVDPAADRETINLELILADMEVAGKRLAAVKSELKSGSDKLKEKKAALFERVVQALEAGKLLNTLEYDEEERAMLKECNFLTVKPFLYVLNLSEDQLPQADALAARTLPGVPPENIIPLCMRLEAELSDLSLEEEREYLESMGFTQTGLEKLITAGYGILNLITFLTTGESETRAWTVTRGSKAPQAAGKIHSDFEAGFIVAETVNWKDLLSAGGWAQARERGLIRTEGKEYVVQDGDVMVFRFGK